MEIINERLKGKGERLESLDAERLGSCDGEKGPGRWNAEVVMDEGRGTMDELKAQGSKLKGERSKAKGSR